MTKTIERRRLKRIGINITIGAAAITVAGAFSSTRISPTLMQPPGGNIGNQGSTTKRRVSDLSVDLGSVDISNLPSIFASSLLASTSNSIINRSITDTTTSQITPDDDNLDLADLLAKRGRTPEEEQRDYEMKIGRAIDTLRADYPDMLSISPDFSLYHDKIEVADPSGVKLHNLRSYKTSFQFLHTVVKFLYQLDESLVTFRLVYDCARKSIRVSWHVALTPHTLVGGANNIQHIDGISVYEFDRTGSINRHSIERLLLNDAPVQTPAGILRAILSDRQENIDGVPVLNSGIPMGIESGITSNVRNHANSKENTPNHRSSSSTSNIITSRSSSKRPQTTLFSSSLDSNVDEGDFASDKHQSKVIDEDALVKKNESRRKFGLPNLTPDEFLEFQTQVDAIAIVQKEKASAAAKAAALQVAQTEANALAEASRFKGSEFISKLFGNAIASTCESNDDCERPEVCCNLIVKKTCCRTGLGVFSGAPGQQMQPKRVIADDGLYAPRGGPDDPGMNRGGQMGDGMRDKFDRYI